jgi:prepilin-type N-terminal cleavage/methylation domain-containing protein
MTSKFKSRKASQEGFTLVELLIVMIVIGILMMVAVPAYLGFRLRAEKATAQSNVSSAITAAAMYFGDSNPATGGNGSYTGLTKAKLQGESRGVSNHVLAGATGPKYCIQDTEGSATYYYEGGIGGTATLTFGLCALVYVVA